MAQLQQEDARKAARKGDDMMGFGNGMNSPSKNTADMSTIDSNSSAVNASSSILISTEEELPQDSKSQLDRKEMEYKNRELTYQKKKLMKVEFMALILVDRG